MNLSRFFWIFLFLNNNHHLHHEHHHHHHYYQHQMLCTNWIRRLSTVRDYVSIDKFAYDLINSCICVFCDALLFFLSLSCCWTSCMSHSKTHTHTDTRTKPWLLSGTPGPLFTILGTYLYFCLYAGPKYMKDRKPFELKKTLIIYNIVQVVLSVVLVIEVSIHSFNFKYTRYNITYFMYVCLFLSPYIYIHTLELI